ncbi:hypothetical protein QFC21_002006 [Naganishia friedmannii]|uniref:Uncharacterized protein n=1 Tax=Naganishia friedmannii TaxID=89922 RepID=A0ACC2VZK1_9TREE|nr:hypothetical protein QFC21_002006 [Naganishia friedmannii]
MPVTTRQQSRASDVDSSGSNRNQRPGPPQTSLLSVPAIPDRDGGRLPDSSRTKAEAIARCIQPSPIENLPSEIIEVIANVLRCQALDEEGRPLGFYKAASEFSESPPPCKCHFGPAPHPTASDMEAITSYRSCEPSIPLSSTSKRFRQVVFDNNPHRMKVIKYCLQSRQRSAEMSEALRGNVRELCVRATRRHVPPPEETQLNHYLRLFPNVQELHLDWEIILSLQDTRLKPSKEIKDLPNLTKLVINSDPDTSEYPPDFGIALYTWAPAIEDLKMLFIHLPLANVKDLDLRLHDWINSRHLDLAVLVLKHALEEMRFPRMETFNVSMTIEVRSVRGCIWTEIEKAYAASLKQDTITQVNLAVYLVFAGCANIASGEAMFTTKEDSHEDISKMLMPTTDQLEHLFPALKKSCKNLRILEVSVIGESAHPDDTDEDKSFDLLTFRMAEDSDDDPMATLSTPRQYSGVVDGHNEKVKYKVHQEAVDKLAQLIRVRMAENPRDIDEEVDEADNHEINDGEDANDAVNDDDMNDDEAHEDESNDDGSNDERLS